MTWTDASKTKKIIILPKQGLSLPTVIHVLGIGVDHTYIYLETVLYDDLKLNKVECYCENVLKHLHCLHYLKSLGGIQRALTSCQLLRPKIIGKTQRSLPSLILNNSSKRHINHSTHVLFDYFAVMTCGVCFRLSACKTEGPALFQRQLDF